MTSGSRYNLPTTYWHEWTRDLHSRDDTVPHDIRLVVAAASRPLGAVYQQWRGLGGDRSRWINAYGPTEAGPMGTAYEPDAAAAALIGAERDPPIGRPLAGVALRVTTPDGAPVPPGQDGEMRIRGAQLARGYLNQPQLTAQRFVVDEAGRRWHRTGDQVRQLADCDLAFRGRLDDQVSIRGYRVECAEVESAMAGHPAVAETLVVARENGPGDRRLVALVVPRGAVRPPVRELRRFLAERLPAYMVPSAFRFVASLPRTSSGKVDRRAPS